MTALSARERLERLTVEAVSPDAVVRLVIRPGPAVSLSISARPYRAYPTVASVERQLEAVLDQGFTAWAAARRELLLEARAQRRTTGASAEPSRIERDAEKAVVTWTAPDASIRLSATGLTRWRVRLARDTLTSLTAGRLADDLGRAVARVLSGHDRALRQLRARYLD